MRLNRVAITGLFDIFNYDIFFPEEEHVLIITGANGFGKTHVLNIVFNIFSYKFWELEHLIFDTVEITAGHKKLKVSKTKSSPTQLTIELVENDKYINSFVYIFEDKKKYIMIFLDTIEILD